MLIADVLKIKGREVVKVRPSDPVALAVGRLAEHRIGAVVVEDQWMKPLAGATKKPPWSAGGPGWDRGFERARI